ncbi:MAG: hypothetical protein ACLQVM_27665 [Terriglobia bacterium]
MAFYLRFEGVNLSNFIEDAEDLSVSRGGSLALLNAPERVLEELQKKFPLCGITPVNVGASSGIYHINDESQETRAKVVDEVRKLLANDGVCKHATFVIDTCPDTGYDGFNADRTAAIALNRWQQMQTQTVMYPVAGLEPILDKNGKRHRVCQLDQVRPAAHKKEHWNPVARERTEEIHSDSANERHEYGRTQKQEFFKGEIRRARGSGPPSTDADSLLGLDYVHDLNSLAGSESGYGVPLKDKIALIYLDGNGFGNKFAEQCKTSSAQATKSAQLRMEQATFLANLLEDIQTHCAGWFFNTQDKQGMDLQQVRLEVLLWGGDEIALVVPAWKGLYTLDFFLTQTKGWKTFNPLSHAAGIVFCNRKCHIHRAKRLAHELAELAKREVKREPGERLCEAEADLVAYQVLESFDHLGHAPDWDFVRARYKFLEEKRPNALLLPGAKLKTLWGAVDILRLV